jgi:hypothetical protein
MEITIFWNITPCGPSSVNRRFALVSCSAYFFDTDDGGDIFPRNVGWYSTDYTALYLRIWYSFRENFIFFFPYFFFLSSFYSFYSFILFCTSRLVLSRFVPIHTLIMCKCPKHVICRYRTINRRARKTRSQEDRSSECHFRYICSFYTKMTSIETKK